MPIETYKNAMIYENFMCRAFRTVDRRKPGIDISYMRNLIDAENGESWVKHLPSAERQLIKIKSYINKAFDKFLGCKKNEDTNRSLIILQMRVEKSSSSTELLDIIEQAMNLTRDLK